MKKIITFLLSLTLISCGLFASYKWINVPKERVVVDIDKEYEEYQKLIYAEEAEQTFADQLEEYMTVKLPLIRTRYSKELKCEVTYPDLQSYWLENQNKLMEMDTEELQSCLLEVCEKGKTKTIKITFPATYSDGYLLLDSDCFEYQNAMFGGLLELAVERYTELLDEMYPEEEK